MKFRIIMNKLNFLWHLNNLEEKSLANEIFQVQRDAKMPGLVRECCEWIEILELPDLFKENITKAQWKNRVRKAIEKYNEDDLRKKMKAFSKLKNSEMIKEHCQTKPYVKNLSVTNARHIFKKRASMTQYVKMNYMSEVRYLKNLWRCDSCQTNIDTMNHVLWCPSYSELRSGKDLHDDQDVANYLHDVMLIRSKLDIQK